VKFFKISTVRTTVSKLFIFGQTINLDHSNEKSVLTVDIRTILPSGLSFISITIPWCAFLSPKKVTLSPTLRGSVDAMNGEE